MRQSLSYSKREMLVTCLRRYFYEYYAPAKKVPFDASRKADFVEFAGIEDLRGALEMHVRALYPAGEAPPGKSAAGNCRLACLRSSTGGSLQVATTPAEHTRDGAAEDHRPVRGERTTWRRFG